MDPTYPQIRWLQAIQEDFAGRADWCVADYDNANHPPQVRALSPDKLTVKPGESVQLEIEATDPDGDEVETSFWIYREVGSYEGETAVNQAGRVFTLALPEQGVGTLHVIAEVKDQAKHSMTRYQRFVIEVR